MKRYTFIYLCLFVLIGLSCEGNEQPDIELPQDDVVTFRSSGVKATRAGNPLTQTDLRVIAPGYGTGATNQTALYDASGGAMTAQAHDIRWSAENMAFTSWSEITGLTVNPLGGTGTVNLNADLSGLIGTYTTKQRNKQDLSYLNVDLEYHHLVARLDITLKNIAEGGTDISSNASIFFPAIKATGIFNADLTGMPTVTAGKAGSELKHAFTPATDSGTGKQIGTLTCYLPQLTPDELLMYGSFTIMDGTSYIGTLQSLGLDSDGIRAGHHYTFDIIINNDHTALVQAVTLAPWEVHDKNVYNRPSKGIWGLEDLQALSKFVNGEATEWNKLRMADLVDDKGVINLYTDIEFEEDDAFAPIGTAANPFAGYEFNGNGYTIHNLSLENADQDNQGLFGVVGNGTTIRNLTVKNASVDGKNNVGMLIGQTPDNGTDILIDHCFAIAGEVLGGENNTGGLIGSCGAGTTIRNCGATPKAVTGNNHVGGFVGRNAGTIGNSYSQAGSIICSGQEGGGFIGRNDGTVRNCYSSASFAYGRKDIGAFAGFHTAGKTMAGCYWNAECINNTTCSKKVGNSTEDANGTELTPGGFSGGGAFNKATGLIIQTTYLPLHDRLNDYMINNPTLTTGYLRWARVAGVALPVFGY